MVRTMMLMEYITSQGTSNHRVHFLRAKTWHRRQCLIAPAVS